MYYTFLRLTAVFGLLAVSIGAFGAHGLRPILSESAYATLQTGVEYHFYHALALGLTAMALRDSQLRVWHLAGWSFSLGIILFSGSLYLLAITGIKWFGPITPLGGVSFLVGWVCLALGTFKQAKS